MTKKPSATTTFFEIDDGTGRIDTRYWPQNKSNDPDEQTMNDEEDETKNWVEGVYVRVYGHLRKFQNNEKTNFVALSMQPIEDFNEITFHLLESVYVHLKNLKDAQMGGMSYGGAANYSNYQQSYEQDAPQGDQDDQQQAICATIHDIIKRTSENSEEGASISYIVQEMSTYGIDEQQIRQSIEYLSSEGHIYPTFDEEHFKA